MRGVARVVEGVRESAGGGVGGRRPHELLAEAGEAPLRCAVLTAVQYLTDSQNPESKPDLGAVRPPDR